MKKLKKEEISQEVYDLYDDYAHNKIDRRNFLEKLSIYAVGGITVSSLMSTMLPDYETTRTIKADDERLSSEYITYNSPKGGGEIKGLFSVPEGKDGKLPAIVVVHENRGLNPYIEDVGRRCAVAGFMSLAPDALTPLGGYPGNDDEGRTMQRKRDRNEMLEDFMAAFEYLKNHPRSNGKVGVVGFCFGGWISNMMAVNLPSLAASVPFYGGQPNEEETAKIKAPLMLQYAGLDTRVNAGWPDYEAALKKHGKAYEAFIYPDVNHGFHNNTTPRYDEAAATLAWERTIGFFEKHLS
ncbi:dienelactone hydrolase family protein [Roseivirga pacifica]|uniref:dienelactone hydrolase family protein n=1 Tax=Roseivirga pacifica TaxID=1267423 RepID=UPI002095573B|nr:dienelactone hydrolase family protein [Roseivirga pacifica]MCO6357747.1 prolyl oligopeptidase family serine peptidase [Roseivirga pacifica]MCO6366000.1 prolyl oligopeptidase family serine peptidase [Roseivirga pacifica]MCO6371328.1 prolyl oligopeptidase family serine peptidase [Roseivirga pacifica]MCO6375501.1 prolyl oligopeptidase family serine peptidase [Roseivirga pacifica]MCO6378706.1 prolyl oligopeptidase family serine peptidase [Roseivirga pacifica]